MRGSPGVNAAIAAGVLLRVGIAGWNGLAGPSFGATADARNFHLFATAVAEGRSAPGADLTAFSYAYALGAVYRVFGPSLLLGSLLSCAAWLASALLLLASLRLLRASRDAQVVALLIYAVLPSSVLWTSVTLREPYQLLSVNLCLWGVLLVVNGDIDARNPGRSTKSLGWGVLAAGSLLGAMLHGTLLISSAFISGYLVAREMWRLLPSRSLRVALASAAIILVPVIGALWFSAMYPNYDFTGGPAAAMERHLRLGMLQPSRTLYVENPAVPNSAALVSVIPAALFRYLFEPMPWKMNRWVDAGFLAENLIRAALIALVAIGVWRLRGGQRQYVVLLLAWYLTIETVWAVGTFNWGTAARHHVPTIGLLLTMATLRWTPAPSLINDDHGVSNH